jgi:DNA-binding transcriptional MerR regulator
MNIKQFSLLSGLSVHTLRYYEKIGLLPEIKRNLNDYRDYSENDIGWVTFLNKLKATGMPIVDMQIFVILKKEGEHNIPQRIEILKKHRQHIENELINIKDTLDKVDYKISCYKNMLKK